MGKINGVFEKTLKFALLFGCFSHVIKAKQHNFLHNAEGNEPLQNVRMISHTKEEYVHENNPDAQRIVQEWVYELPHDVYDTQGLFDVEDEGKQDDQGLLEDV